MNSRAKFSSSSSVMFSSRVSSMLWAELDILGELFPKVLEKAELCEVCGMEIERGGEMVEVAGVSGEKALDIEAMGELAISGETRDLGGEMWESEGGISSNLSSLGREGLGI